MPYVCLVPSPPDPLLLCGRPAGTPPAFCLPGTISSVGIHSRSSCCCSRALRYSFDSLFRVLIRQLPPPDCTSKATEKGQPQWARPGHTPASPMAEIQSTHACVYDGEVCESPCMLMAVAAAAVDETGAQQPRTAAGTGCLSAFRAVVPPSAISSNRWFWDWCVGP